MFRICMAFGLLVVMVSCKKDDPKFLFSRVDNSGIKFNNQIVENDSMNILDLEYFYRGGGVAIADLNHDHLPEIILGGNMTPSRIYLNKGGFEFEDVSEATGFAPSRWINGISLVDINQDGFQDIYLSVGGSNTPSMRQNIFYVSEGTTEDGLPLYQDRATEYGLNSNQASTQAAFFDYDRDGDYDMILVNTDSDNKNPNTVKIRMNDGSANNNDQLFENRINTEGRFVEVTQQAGILYEGFSLGVAITDINEDGWPDIYVANDHITNDVFYINNGNKTFTNRITELVKNQSYYSMGVTVQDFVNNGKPDIFTLDMMPETNERKQKMMMAMNVTRFAMARDYEYEIQFMRNTLQINQGFNASGKLVFTDLGQFTGIHNTDWSWGCVAADFDLNSYNDLIIANGYARDITDLDFVYYQKTMGYFDEYLEDPGYKEMLNKQPPILLSNYAFANEGELNFRDNTSEWGLSEKNLSNGMAYGDLDGDGDLDLVINHINQQASIYKNNARNDDNHYLGILPLNQNGNILLGTKAYLYSGNNTFYKEMYPVQGYQSMQQPILHFGLDTLQEIDSLKLIWPDESVSRMLSVPVDSVYHIKKEATEPANQLHQEEPIFFSSGVALKNWKHQASIPYKDFYNQPLIPQTYSKESPKITCADIDGNGLSDCFVSTGMYQQGLVLMQTNINQFEPIFFDKGGEFEDMNAAWLDANGDGYLDLYVTTGSVNFYPGHKNLQDRIYLNQNGTFQYAPELLPKMRTFTKEVVAHDFDMDGDTDLLVLGRMVNGKFPAYPQSWYLENSGSGFSDASGKLPEGGKIGMIASATQADLDGDSQHEVLLAGEWQPLKILKHKDDHFYFAEVADLDDYKGWWQNVQVADINQDGLVDILAGNVGLNHAYAENMPLVLFDVDLDNDNFTEPVVAWNIPNQKGERKLYPLAQRDALVAQVPSLKRKYQNYVDFAAVTMDELLTVSNQEYTSSEINFLENVIFINRGNLAFEMKKLPKEAQFGPGNSFVVKDFNQDKLLDILVMGNNSKMDVAMCWNNNSIGALLLNKNNEFQAVDNQAYSLFINELVQDACLINNNSLLYAAYNDSLRILSWPDQATRFISQRK